MAQGKGLPDEVLRKLASDPDFRKMDPDAQDRIVSRFSQEGFGQVPKSENILSKAVNFIRPIAGPSYQGVGGALNTAAFGLPGLAVDKFAPQGVKDFIKPQGIGEQIGRTTGDIGGFIYGGPEKLAAKGIEKGVAKLGINNPLTRGAVMGTLKNPFLRGALKGTAAVGSLEAPQVLAGNESPGMGALKTAGGGLLQGVGETILPPVIKAFSNPIQTVKSGLGWFAEPWQNVSKISKFKNSAIGDVENIASSELGAATKKGSMQKQVVSKLYGDEPTASLESNKAYLNKKISTSSDVEAQNLQSDLPKLYKKKSDEFGQGLSKLVGDKPIPVPASRIQPQLEQSLLEHGVLKFDEAGNIVPSRAPINPNETKIFNMYRNFKQGLQDNPDIVVDASDLLKSQQSMKVPFGNPLKGSDMLMNSVKKNVSSVLEDYVPGLKEFRSSHAPYLQGKYQSIKELNPFSNEYNTGKASGFIEKLAKGDLDPDEKRLVGFLENNIGREIGKESKAFGNKLEQVPKMKTEIQNRLQSELSRVERTLEDAKTAISSKKALSVKDIENTVDEMIRKNNLEKWKRVGIATGGSLIVKNYVLNRVLNWYSRKPIE